jgi:hypothetical protein
MLDSALNPDPHSPGQPLDFATLVAELSKLAAHASKVEGRLKEAENIRNKQSIAAVNELRYAGRRILCAWSLVEKVRLSETVTHTQLTEISVELKAAGTFLWNADDDLTDDVIAHVSTEVREALKRHGRNSIIQHYSGIDNLRQGLKEAAQLKVLGRRDFDKRREHYKVLEERYVPYLLTEWSKLRDAEEVTLTHMRVVERANLFWKLLTLISFLVTLFFGVLGTPPKLNTWFWSKFDSPTLQAMPTSTVPVSPTK